MSATDDDLEIKLRRSCGSGAASCSLPVVRMLADIPTAELREEIARQERTPRKSKFKNCDECWHFVPWTGTIEPPKNYNPCRKGHIMSFRSPANYGDTDWGFHLIGCPDRCSPSEAENNTE
jgi:hypothetical protein